MFETTQTSTSTQSEYDKKCLELEKQELDAPNGVPPAHIYQQLLAIYLLQNDLTGAKFLWKRIPANTKSACTELELIWNVGKNLWERDLPAVYRALNQEWSPTVKEIMKAVKDSVRQRAIRLVGQAYTSIKATDFSQLIGTSVEDAVATAKKLNWEYDPALTMIMPKKTAQVTTTPTPSEEQLQRLVEYVSFLEN